MHALVLAGGYATRLWPLTEQRPKPLLPVGGRPLLSHLVRGIPAEIPITVSTNAAFESNFNQWMKEHPHHAPIQLAIEQTRSDSDKLGALGAVRQWIAANSIHDDVLLMTGDNYLGFRQVDFLKRYAPGTPLLATHDIRDRARATSFGTVMTDESNRVTGFEEKPKDPKTTLISTGCSIIPVQYLGLLQEFAEKNPDNVGSLFEEFLRRGIALESFTFTDPWLDIGSFDSYLEAHQLVTGETAIVHRTAKVEESILTGSVAIEANSVVTRSTLHDTIIFGGSTITDCRLRRCVVDEGCVLQGVELDGQMLRAGTELVVQ